ncbi:MAG TPA: IPTL-CTERM sorting domain-containing protein [Thermoanaerobaculia bacterium]|nr:IPTL-CTERM sorting domain-containing protein [Thermoanaerobaculia bacterium]
MRRILAVAALSLVTAPLLHADVSIIERREARTKVGAGKPKGGHHPGGATGSLTLIDSQGLKYFINTNITFSTSPSNASGAASSASYTHSVAASTSGGGTTMSTPNDAYDNYNAMCLSLNNTVATCLTDNANFVIYNQNGPPTTECPGPVSHVNRQVVFPPKTAGNIQMSRKVFVPDNDQFARWLNYFTNTGGSPQTVTAVIANNLGSDSNTIIVSDSGGNTSPDVTSTWVTTFQNYTPAPRSTDVRLGHVLQQTGAPVQLAGIFFQNGNDRPFWGYTFTLAPGETKIIANFGVGEPSKAAANAKAAQLAGLPPNALQCLSTAEQAEIANFNAAPAPPIATVPTLSLGALAALVALLGIAAVWFLRRRATA